MKWLGLRGLVGFGGIAFSFQAVSLLGIAEVQVVQRLCGNQISGAINAESSRRPPRHRRDACSIAWRCRFLTARQSQHGSVIAAPDSLFDLRTGVEYGKDVLGNDDMWGETDKPVRRAHPTILH